MSKKQMLLLSFSKLTADARILRQIELFKDQYAITTCGYGKAPAGVAAHLQIPDELVYWRYPRLALILHQYRMAYFKSPAVRFAYRLLKKQNFDIVWANDFDTLPLAFALKPALGVHADIHEYFLSAEERPLPFRLFVQPFRLWVLKKYLPLCRSVTSVTPTISKRYEKLAGKPVGTVVNAAPFQNLNATAVHDPIRLVHVGAAMPGRGLEEIIEAVTKSSAPITLDCYLLPNNQVLQKTLEDQALKSEGKVRVLPPIPHQDLVTKLNDYDASLIFIQPTHFSYEYCLPNKLFQSIQARLGVITAPLPEVANIVHRYQIGTVTGGYKVDDLVLTLNQITADEVTGWKKASMDAAKELNAETESGAWLDTAAF